jgi:hypothetical protein
MGGFPSLRLNRRRWRDLTSRASIQEQFLMIAVDPVTLPQSSPASKFSLVIGGPFYKALMRIRLVENPGPNIRGRLLTIILLTWAPLLVLSLVHGTAFGNEVKMPFLYDFSGYGSFLAGLPLLVVAEIVIDPGMRRVVSMFESSGAVSDRDVPAYHRMLQGIARLRDSGWAELALAILASFPFFLFAGENEWVSNGISTWHGSMASGLSHAGWWFAFVSSPLLRFLMFRWIWRYVLWSLLLRKVAQLNLEMLPTHPDLLGGLGFVLSAQGHFGILFTAFASVVAGHYADAIAYFDMPGSATEAPAAVFLVLAILIVLGPLTLFSPGLFAARRDGLARYGQLARRLSESFGSKWVSNADPPESMLGSPDPSSLADYVASYNVVRAM